ncbi:DUF4214 domain-containing protein [Roseiterribacter gracilis]|uniref:DUF4214 domain-containing protein n=1 Tax=Roseiterribacter gracilis TaxID=2812848 RepID=A0A8S8XFL8_9PROT|nr:hypothetical protein TMPK1_20970 [Rhodospirillales bacterium TMPK1]
MQLIDLVTPDAANGTVALAGLSGHALLAAARPAWAPTPASDITKAGFAYTVTMNDPTGALSDLAPLMIANMQAALAQLAKVIGGKGSLEVEIRVDNTPTGRFGGGVGSIVNLTKDGTRQITETSAAHELRTGEDVTPGAPDVIIFVANNDYIRKTIWLDPTPTLRDEAVPTNRNDGVTLFMHEILHSFGITGYTPTTSPFTLGTTATVWDAYLANNNGALTFTGPSAVAAWGGAVPVTTNSDSQNSFHLGLTPFAQATAMAGTTGVDGLLYDNMNGTAAFFGERYDLSALDLAIMEDLGLRVFAPAGMPIVNLSDARNIGTAAADTINGSVWDEFLSGLGGNDTINGGGGDDFIVGGAGNDTIDGGTGTNRAIYSDSRTNYTVGAQANGTIVVDGGTKGADGKDTLTNIKVLQFSDQTMFRLTGDEATVARLYSAAFARAPDVDGLLFQIQNGLGGGLSLQQLAANFISSAEFVAKYGANVSNTAYVTALYTNVLGRIPDPAGFDFQLNALNTGVVNRTTLLLNFADAPENKAKVIGTWMVGDVAIG